jgi:hypothetical protein
MLGIGKIGKMFGAGKSQTKYNREEIEKAQNLWKNMKAPSVNDLMGKKVTSSYNQEDPRLKQYQLSAIDDLRNIYSQGGLDANAKARLEDIRRKEDMQSKGAREAIMQDARSRGVGGGSLVSQMMNAQGSADRRSYADTQVAADSEQRAIKALMDSANLSGDVRRQDFSKMSALDKIKEFNARNRADAFQQNFANRYNVGAQRSGLYKNMGEAMATGEDQNFGFGTGVLGGAAKLLGRAPWDKIAKGMANSAAAAGSGAASGGSDDGYIYDDSNMPAPGQSGGDWNY